MNASPRSVKQIGRGVVIVLAAIVLGAMRIIGMKSPSFQAVAHLYVGGLFGAAYAAKVHRGTWDHLLLWTGVALSVLELLAFLLL